LTPFWVIQFRWYSSSVLAKKFLVKSCFIESI
jgi:hypothetical protein